MMQWMRTDEVGLDALAEAVGAAFTGALLDVTHRRERASPEEWGFDAGRLHDSLAEYMSAFGIAPE